MTEPRWTPEFKHLPTDDGGEVVITVTQPEDPAYFLLHNGHTSTPTVYRDNCYICRDPEFAQMGLPLCKFCPICETGHVPADDSECSDCGEDVQVWYQRAAEAQCSVEGHAWKHYPSHPITNFKLDGPPEEGMTDSYTSCTRCRVRQA